MLISWPISFLATADTAPPVITSSSSASVAEGATLSHALTANEAVTWSIVGGADQAKFEISGSTLRWLANGTKDYDLPDDADTNNAYIVTARATDSALNFADQTITVTVTDAVVGTEIQTLVPGASGPVFLNQLSVAQRVAPGPVYINETGA